MTTPDIVNPEKTRLLDDVRRRIVDWTAPQVIKDIAEQVDSDWRTWWHNCHAASLKIVRARVIDGARVARGTARGIGGQHSWIVVGNPYKPDAIYDPTRWSYEQQFVGFRIDDAVVGDYRPHGAGHFFKGSPPQHHGGETIHLTPRDGGVWSTEAREWLRLVGAPFDSHGWAEVAHLPVEGWPAGEVFAAMDANPKLQALIPIDILGMTTDLNPQGLYLPEEE